MRIARHFLVTGRVQGVGFRYFVLHAATVEGLHGWVRNLPDGRVEAHAEGEFESVVRFERQIRQGPPASRVDGVDVEETAATGHDTGFDVR
ncbi:MAG: acylphosphatase [Vicinamibacterales bacterium]